MKRKATDFLLHQTAVTGGRRAGKTWEMRRRLREMQAAQTRTITGILEHCLFSTRAPFVMGVDLGFGPSSTGVAVVDRDGKIIHMGTK